MLGGGRDLLIAAFDANVTRLIQLYILGVFLSFTLSQAGMVRHWSRLIRGEARRRSGAASGASGFSTDSAPRPLELVFADRPRDQVANGAWIVVLATPILFAAMKAVSAHYRQLRVTAGAIGGGHALPERIHAVVLVSNLLAPTLRALAFAQAGNPASLRAVTVASEDITPTGCHANGGNVGCRFRWS